jgi:hypothetical protein
MLGSNGTATSVKSALKATVADVAQVVNGNGVGNGVGSPFSNGAVKHARGNGTNKSSRRRFRGRICKAPLKAVTAAKLYLSGGGLTVVEAANCCGSSSTYVVAAITILNSENEALLDDVLYGRISLLAAAKIAAPLAALMVAFRKATPQALTFFSATTGFTDDLSGLALRSVPDQRAEAGRALGAATVWDEMIVPVIDAPLPLADRAPAAATVTQPSGDDDDEVADW